MPAQHAADVKRTALDQFFRHRFFAHTAFYCRSGCNACGVAQTCEQFRADSSGSSLLLFFGGKGGGPGFCCCLHAEVERHATHHNKESKKTNLLRLL
jgi:hypothetical protein